jgi:small subunit ribosomal protein S4
MKRKHKKYSKPKRPFDKARIEEEAQIVKEFGLKNKKEIWKADARINAMREKAKRMINADENAKKKFFELLQKIGLKVESLADVLSLDKKDYLNRRLQTIVFKKKFAPTIKTARQMIVHKKVLVDGKAVNIPSYIVPVELEDKITLKMSKKKIETATPVPKTEAGEKPAGAEVEKPVNEEKEEAMAEEPKEEAKQKEEIKEEKNE